MRLFLVLLILLVAAFGLGLYIFQDNRPATTNQDAGTIFLFGSRLESPVSLELTTSTLLCNGIDAFPITYQEPLLPISSNPTSFQETIYKGSDLYRKKLHYASPDMLEPARKDLIEFLQQSPYVSGTQFDAETGRLVTFGNATHEVFLQRLLMTSEDIDELNTSMAYDAEYVATGGKTRSRFEEIQFIYSSLRDILESGGIAIISPPRFHFIPRAHADADLATFSTVLQSTELSFTEKMAALGPIVNNPVLRNELITSNP